MYFLLLKNSHDHTFGRFDAVNDDDDDDDDDGDADEYEDGNHPSDCVCDMIFGCTCDRCAVAMKGL